MAYGKLTLKNVSSLDSGIYSCRVGDMWESTSAHVEIKIGNGPYFYTNESEIIPFGFGKIYNLICLAKALPEPKVFLSTLSLIVLDSSLLDISLSAERMLCFTIPHWPDGGAEILSSILAKRRGPSRLPPTSFVRRRPWRGM